MNIVRGRMLRNGKITLENRSHHLPILCFGCFSGRKPFPQQS